MSQPFDAVTMTLELQGSQPLTLNCLAVQYQAKIHALYELKMQLVLEDFDFLLNTPCQVKISTKQFQRFIFSGQLGAISEGTTFNLDGRLDWLTIVPDCSILYQQFRSGIYYDASILDVIERGLKTVALQKNLSAPEGLAYPRQKSITQYAEPDMAFIARQLAEYGIWYHFYQDFEIGSPAIMRLGDHNQAFIDRGRMPILSDVQSEGGGLFDVEWNAIPLPDAVQGIHFVEEENLYLNSGEGALQHHTLGNQLNQKQLDYLTAVAKAGIQGQQQILTASFQGLNLQPGEVIHIDCDDLPIAFVITEVYYDFSSQHTLKAAALIDLEGHPLTYRTPIWVDSQRVYPPPELTGILSGCYGLSDGEVVVPDALGNIPVYFPYDYEECCGNQIPARLTRMASWSNQGGQTGKTFPIYKDTELQVLFANGNMDYPLIKGAAANAETGHLHNASVNCRTHWQLPQGQHLSYSNVRGDDNFIHLGAAHTEDTHRSSMLLTNYRDPDQPGTKRLDYQQSTTNSMERVTGQDYHSQQGGHLTVLDTPAKVNPMTYLVIQLTDQTNPNAPDKAPTLKTYLKTLLLDFTLDKQGRDASLSLTGLSVNPAQKFKLQQLLEPNVQADTLRQYGALTVALAHSSASTANQADAVNVILLNGTPILPVNALTLSPMLFNFRQDVYQSKKQLTGADLAAYPILLPYFAPDQDSLDAAQWMRDAFTEEELEFFISQGNNATFFIHGYNVGFGKARRSDDDISASAAHQRFRQMESHLNIAAGFDQKDYTKYTRLIGIAWQGVNYCSN
ncbi:MAG: contractile injection system protein, VgrG/Pvc8 family [Gammaproteobacteria bacterium]|nr:contractile injection system protein, VgrG/Pvc8 family [Gammaproteobacteria bacterium]